MSAAEAAAAPARPPAFAPRTILALVAVGLVSFSGLAVLAAYAPELRSASDPGPHALSSSAVGFKGAIVMLQAEGVPAAVSRTPPRGPVPAALTVLTPPHVADLKPFAQYPALLIVLPKWVVTPMPLHPGFVQKYGDGENTVGATELLAPFAKATEIQVRPKGFSKPVLRGTGALFDTGTYLPLGPIDNFQTLSGEAWEPMLVDEQGHAVLARLRTRPGIVVLADPDLLNNQGVAHIDNARAGLAILETLRGESGLRFDVTINGFKNGYGIGRLMLEPPWLAATLCGVAAALLMGLHGLARFGPTIVRGRAIALGKQALVDNSAGLVRMARREHELAPAYATLTQALIRRFVGGGDHGATGGEADRWLTDLARQRGAAAPEDLAREAGRAQSRDALLAVGRKLYLWRVEITGERR